MFAYGCNCSYYSLIEVLTLFFIVPYFIIDKSVINSWTFRLLSSAINQLSDNILQSDNIFSTVKYFILSVTVQHSQCLSIINTHPCDCQLNRIVFSSKPNLIHKSPKFPFSSPSTLTNAISYLWKSFKPNDWLLLKYKDCFDWNRKKERKIWNAANNISYLWKVVLNDPSMWLHLFDCVDLMPIPYKTTEYRRQPTWYRTVAKKHLENTERERKNENNTETINIW